jgi:Concanavalin A-like lectin/glucanases superfamily
LSFLIRVSSGLLQPFLSISPNISADSPSYSIGDIISVTVAYGPGDATNTVGLYQSGKNAAIDAPVDWKYLASNNQTLPGAGVAGGVVTIDTAGLASGNYFVAFTDIPYATISKSGADTSAIALSESAAISIFANGVVFNGSTYLLLTSQFTGAVDSTKFSVAFAVKFTGTASDQHILGMDQSINNGYPALVVGRDASNKIYIYAANTTTRNITMVSNTALTVGQWYVVFISWDGSVGASSCKMWINDASNLAASPVCNNVAQDYTCRQVTIGTYPGTPGSDNNFVGELSELWFDIGRAVDWSVVGNRRLFFDASNNIVLNKGANGQIPFTATPTGYFSGPTSSWQTNKGSGTGMTLGGGTGVLTTSLSLPPGV